jgi:hypothetical protein
MNVYCWIETGTVVHRLAADLKDGRLIAHCGIWCDQTDGTDSPTHAKNARPAWRHCSRCFRGVSHEP